MFWKDKLKIKQILNSIITLQWQATCPASPTGTQFCISLRWTVDISGRCACLHFSFWEWTEAQHSLRFFSARPIITGLTRGLSWPALQRNVSETRPIHVPENTYVSQKWLREGLKMQVTSLCQSDTQPFTYRQNLSFHPGVTSAGPRGLWESRTNHDKMKLKTSRFSSEAGKQHKRPQRTFTCGFILVLRYLWFSQSQTCALYTKSLPFTHTGALCTANTATVTWNTKMLL